MQASEGLRVGMSLQQKHGRSSADSCRQRVEGMGLVGRGGEGVLGESWDRRSLKRCRQGRSVGDAGRSKGKTSAGF